MMTQLRVQKRLPLLQLFKSAAATSAAWVLADWLITGPPPVFAAIAALLVVQPSVNQSFAKAIERSIGVILGVIVASLLGLAFGTATWVVLVAVLVSLGVAWALKMTSPSANQVAISAMLVIALGATTPDYALDRVLETLIGAAIGVVLNVVVVPPVRSGPAKRDLALLGGEVAASVTRLADALGHEQSNRALQQLMIEARLMRPMREAAEVSIADGEESLTLNPRRSAHRDELVEQQRLLQKLTPLVTQVIGMTRAFADHYDPSLHDEPTVQAIEEQLRRVAHDIRLAVHLAELDPEPLTSAIPALTAPLVVKAPDPHHWILIGSLMEDLRRMREILLDDDLATGPG